MYTDSNGIEWALETDAKFVQSFEGVTTWAADLHKVGTAGNLAQVVEMYFNDLGECWL